eukprot:6490314-Amphidinium_carterae.3
MVVAWVRKFATQLCRLPVHMSCAVARIALLYVWAPGMLALLGFIWTPSNIETGLTDSSLGGVNAALKDRELQVLHSNTAAWKRSANNKWRADTGSTPGVGIVCSKLVAIREAPAMTDGAKKLIQMGRLCMAEMCTKAAPILIMSVYLHSGANAGPQRLRMFEALMSEVIEQARQMVVLAGDFNESWHTSPFPVYAAHVGLRQLMWEDLRESEQYTYQCAQTRSCIDYVFVSHPVAQGCTRPVIDRCDKLQHALVHMQVSCVKRMLEVKRLPRIVDSEVPRVDEAVGASHWVAFEPYIHDKLSVGEIQQAYDSWVVGVRRLLYPSGHIVKGASLPGHLVRPIHRSVSNDH